MIEGSNAYIEIRPRADISLVAEMIFSFFAGKTRTLILTKRYPEDVTEINGKLYLGFTQEDTVRLYNGSGNGCVELETQVNLKDKSVIQQPQRGIRLYRRRAVEIVNGNSPRYDMPDTVIDIVTGDMVLVKGKDGIPGTSVAVASVTESEESGGENVVEFTDGKKLKVKNGKDIKPLIVTLTPTENEGTCVSSHSSEEIIAYVTKTGGSSLCITDGGAIGTLAAINEGKVSYRYSEHAVEHGCAFCTVHIDGNTAVEEVEIYPKHLRVDITTTGNSAVLKTSHSAEEIILFIEEGGYTTANYDGVEYTLCDYSNIGDTYYVRYATMKLYRNYIGEALVGQSLITINGNDVSEDSIIHALPFVRTGRGSPIHPDTGLGQIEGFAGEFYEDEDTGKIYLCTGGLSWVLLNKDVNLDDVLKFTKQSLTEEQQKQARANIGTEKETVSGYLTIPADAWKSDYNIYAPAKEVRIQCFNHSESKKRTYGIDIFTTDNPALVTHEWQTFSAAFRTDRELSQMCLRIYGGAGNIWIHPYDITNIKIYSASDETKTNLISEDIAKLNWWMPDSTDESDRFAVSYDDGLKYLHVFKQSSSTLSAVWAVISNETANSFPKGAYVLELDMRITCDQLYCTMPLDGIRDASATIITPTEASSDICTDYGVRGFAQRIGEISFTADAKPTEDITVTVNASYGSGGSMVTVYDEQPVELVHVLGSSKTAAMSQYGTLNVATFLINSHNDSSSAHRDIRTLISDLTTRLNALADSDDITLDQLSEIVAYIKSNKDLIDAVTTSKVSVADIIDNLETNVSDQPLSARMGMELKRLIDAIEVPDSAVQSVNGKTGEVKLTASDVGAASAGSVAELKAEVDQRGVSVKSHGAVGDGAEDDTAAFQDALAENRRVFVPGGVYKLSGDLVIRDNCELELAQDAVLNFTQTEGNCITLMMSSSLKGNHANVNVPYTFSGNVIYVYTSLNHEDESGEVYSGTSIYNVPSFGYWDGTKFAERFQPQWKTGRYITDINIQKLTTDGFAFSTDGTCYGTAVYISADDDPNYKYDSTYIWGLNFSGLRISGGFKYGIKAYNHDYINSDNEIDWHWNHEMRIEAFIEYCEIGVSLENCNNSYVSAIIQPSHAGPNNTSIVYAKHGIELINSRNTDLSGSRVWDWDAKRTLWSGDATTGCVYQYLALKGDCRNTIVNDFRYGERNEIRELYYTGNHVAEDGTVIEDTCNLETLIVLQEPINRWFKSQDGKPYFFDGGATKELAYKSQLDGIINGIVSVPQFTDLIPKAIDMDGNIFNGVGYKKGYGEWKSGTGVFNESAESYMSCTGLIPLIYDNAPYADENLKLHDKGYKVLFKVYLSGINLSESYTQNGPVGHIVFYDSNFNKITSTTTKHVINNSYAYATDSYKERKDIDGCEFAVVTGSVNQAAYMSITFYTGVLGGTAPIVTIEQDIVYITGGSLSKDIYVDESCVVGLGTKYMQTANKTTAISSESTDEQYPSAKAVYTALQDIVGNSVDEISELIGGDE